MYSYAGSIIGMFGGKTEVNGQVNSPSHEIRRIAFSAGSPMFQRATAIFGYNATDVRNEGAPDAKTFIVQLRYLY